MEHLWERTSDEIVYDAGIFRVRKDLYRYRDRPAGHPFFVLEARDWVNVIAVTPLDEVVCVRQYRHGIRALSLEIPGGIIDPSDRDPGAAAVRELREETGYAGKTVRHVVTVTSNPAILSNRTHVYTVQQAERVGPQQPDEHEDLDVVLVPARKISQLVANGAIQHSLSIAALGSWSWSRDT